MIPLKKRMMMIFVLIPKPFLGLFQKVFFLTFSRLIRICVLGIFFTSCVQNSNSPISPNFKGSFDQKSSSSLKSSLQTNPSTKTFNYLKPEIPTYVLSVWAYIQSNHKAPEGYVGGRSFGNFEHRLPIRDNNGLTIHYQEWDLHPHQRNINRGAERLITSSNGKAYYTADHYQTFLELNVR